MSSLPPDNQELLERYRILRSSIEHEDQLINHRLSWLVSSQSFMLTAYAISLNAPSQFKVSEYSRLNTVLFEMLPYAGLATVALIYPTIIGAILALSRLRSFARHQCPEGLPPVHGTRLTVMLGLCGPVLIPLVFAIAWGILLISHFMAAKGT